MPQSNRRQVWGGLALCLVLALGLQGCQFSGKLASDIFEQPVFAPTPVKLGKSQSESLGQMETFIHARISDIRVKNGLEPLKRNAKLDQVARNYSRLMAEKNFFSHYGPKGESVADRVRGAGIFYLVVGENLAKSGGYNRPATVAVEGWMQSPGHRENVLRPVFRESGVGAWRQGRATYFTQVFLKAPGF